jgi:HEAT repeats
LGGGCLTTGWQRGLLCAVADHATRPLPSHRAALYERILIRVLRHEHRPPAAAADHVTRLLDVLAPVAYRCAVTPTGWADRMSSDTLIQAIRESGPPYAELLARKRDAAALLGELAQYDGILVPSGTETADDPPSYLFLHRTFHEYLGARHLAHLPDDQWQAVVEEHLWFDPDWEQVILLLTAQLPQPETLLQLLLDQPHDPFHHALRMAGLALSELPEQSPALPSPAAEEAVRRLLDLLRSPGYGTSMAADVLRTVGVRLQPHAEKSLLSVLTDNDFDVRRTATGALAGRPGEQVTQGLLSALTDNFDGVRWAATDALAGRPGEQVTQGLLSALTDNDFDVRRTATDALAARPGEQVTQGLLSALTCAAA